MSGLIDLTGQKFNKLTVLKRDKDHIQPNGQHKTKWLCRCDCGEYTSVTSYDLRHGLTKSCGCHRKTLPSIVNKKYNHYQIIDDYGVGYTRNGEIFYFDKEDYDKIKDYCWCMSNSYIISTKNNKIIWLHRLVMNLTDENMYIDHINHIKHDNRKSNLRIVTSSENRINIGIRSNNKSGVTGVTFDVTRNKWRSYLNINGKQIYLGRFDTIEEAKKARLNGEQKYFGEFSYANSMNLAEQNSVERIELNG